MSKGSYEVIPTKIKEQWRFIVVGDEGIVLDNARGYGYKTIASAHKGYGHTVKYKQEKLNSEMDSGFSRSIAND